MFCSLQCTSLLTPCLSLFLSILSFFSANVNWIVFLISFSNYSWQCIVIQLNFVFEFCVPQLCWICLLVLPFVCMCVCVWFRVIFWVLHVQNHAIFNRENFICLWFGCLLFLLLSWQLWLWLSIVEYQHKGESRLPCLVPYLRRDFSFSSLSMMLVVAFILSR